MDVKLLTVHSGSMTNSLSSSVPTTDLVHRYQNLPLVQPTPYPHFLRTGKRQTDSSRLVRLVSITWRVQFLVTCPVADEWLVARRTRHCLHVVTKPKTDEFEKRGVTGAKSLNFYQMENKSWNKSKLNGWNHLPRKRVSGWDFVMKELNGRISDRWRTRSNNVFSTKSKEMRGRVLVFIDGLHGRRSDASIRDTSQSTNNTCRTP